MTKHKNNGKSKKKQRSSWCDGFGVYDQHPTSRRLVEVDIYGIRSVLCPDCLKDYRKSLQGGQ